MQSRLMSLFEAVANVAAGFVVALGVQVVLFPIMGWQPTLGQHLTVSAVFTVASVLRSYAMRRLFERLR